MGHLTEVTAENCFYFVLEEEMGDLWKPRAEVALLIAQWIIVNILFLQ